MDIFWNHIHYITLPLHYTVNYLATFTGMQATLREFEDWLEDSVPDAIMAAYEKALAKLEECLPFEDTLVRLADK